MLIFVGRHCPLFSREFVDIRLVGGRRNPAVVVRRVVVVVGKFIRFICAVETCTGVWLCALTCTFLTIMRQTYIACWFDVFGVWFQWLRLCIHVYTWTCTSAEGVQVPGLVYLQGGANIHVYLYTCQLVMAIYMYICEEYQKSTCTSVRGRQPHKRVRLWGWGDTWPKK